MPYFRSPKVFFGKGMLRRLGGEIAGKGTRAVIITGKVGINSCGRLVEAVENAGYEVKVWGGTEPEPSVGVVNAGSKVLLDFEPQLVIGFGGGSSIDTAKLAWLLYERPDLAGTELDKTAGVKVTLNLRRKARFMAVPTTSGSGSDVSWAAVLTDKARHRKMAIANTEIVPDISLLDPEFALAMPKGLTASTGLDALAAGLEGYTARQQTDFTDGLCLQATKMVFEWLPKVCRDGSDLEAREKMHNAASIAGLGFSNGNTSLGHALGHSIGATFEMPHGRAVGIALPYSLEYIISNPVLPNAPDPVARLGTMARFVGIEGKPDKESALKLIQKVRGLAREIGEPLSLKEAGIGKKQMDEAIDTLVSLSLADVNMFSSPCECTEEKLKRLFHDIWAGKVLS